MKIFASLLIFIGILMIFYKSFIKNLPKGQMSGMDYLKKEYNITVTRPISATEEEWERMQNVSINQMMRKD